MTLNPIFMTYGTLLIEHSDIITKILRYLIVLLSSASVGCLQKQKTSHQTRTNRKLFTQVHQAF
jgi:hypothetical protein